MKFKDVIFKIYILLIVAPQIPKFRHSSSRENTKANVLSKYLT